MNQILWKVTLTAMASIGFWLSSHPTNAIAWETTPSQLAKQSVATQPVATQPVTVQPVTKQQDDTAGAWIPVDRIDPTRPASIVLINDTNIALEYAFSTTEMRPQMLEPGETVTLSNVPVPSTLLINAQTSMAVLDYAFGSVGNVPEPENAATVTFSLVDQQFNAVGFNAIDIHETGALYRY
ncbi:MAG: hypothetical protein F6K30_07100 [Cyanothece sp. SIO2G6]|nr:hypothetical protein [Cyanothece sp. SIO2G6]